MTTVARLPGSDRTRLALLAAAIAVLWAATRPYTGIVHDSRLYTLLALRPDHPRLATDLFVRFGSQDRFTLFSPLYRPLIALLGVGRAAMTLTLVAATLWLGAAYVLARALAGDTVLALAAVAGAVALPNTYGSGLVFSYGEAFATPRPFAEAATMIALAFALRQRLGLAVVAIVAGGLVHPVMVLPGAAVVFLYAARRAPVIWLAPVALAAAGLGLAAAGVAPFSRIGVSFDPQWLGIVQARTGLAFLRLWTWPDVVILAGQVLLAVIVAARSPPPTRRLVLTALGVAGAGLALTYAGADLLHNQLLASLQLWRATWLVGFTGNLLLVPLLVRVAHERQGPPALRLALFGAAFFLFATPLLGVSYVVAVALLAVAAVLAVAAHRAAPRASALAPAGIASMAVVAVATIVTAVVVAWRAPILTDDPTLLWRLQLLYAAGLGLLLVATVARLPHPPVPWSRLAAVAAAGLVVVAAASWDSRSGWQRLVEADAPAADLPAFAPPSASVYWAGNPEILWFALRQPSYYSCAQGAGVVFFRATALAFAHRQDSFRFESPASAACERRPGEPTAAPAGAELRRACAREPGLDYIILPDDLAGLWDRRWVPPVRHWEVALRDHKPAARIVAAYFRYPCAVLRGST